jgi:hypothetical protein
VQKGGKSEEGKKVEEKGKEREIFGIRFGLWAWLVMIVMMVVMCSFCLSLFSLTLLFVVWTLLFVV